MGYYREHVGIVVRDWEMLKVLSDMWLEMGFGDVPVDRIVMRLVVDNREVLCWPTNTSG